jgi:hypothetical protein
MDTSIELPIILFAEHLTHGHMQQSRLGLQQPSGSTAVRKRAPPKSAPKRAGPNWATMQVLSEHATHRRSSNACVSCGAELCGGANRVRDHITGGGALTACPCETDTFLDLKQN